MKKNVLALSIAAMIGGLGFAGAASAEVVPGTATFVPGTSMTATNATVLQISDAGTGHNLLVPYFNAQNGNMSVFHVVNTDTVNGKAAKVRFRSASNSDDILDFQVFLSPGDVWTAAVTEGADGVAQIVTNDNTCTVPTLTAGVPQSFVKNRLNSRLSNADQANHTREGYVEIFNMADIPPVTATPAVTPANSLYLATKHANAVAPCSVAGSPARTLLDTIATTNYADEPTASAAGFNTPSTGLMGDWYIINVPQTTTFSGAATSVTARVAVNGAAGRGNFVHFPQTEVPVAAAQVLNFTADPLFRTDARAATAGNGGDYAAATVGTAAIAAASYDLPDMSTPYTTTANGVVDAQSPLVQAGLLTSALAVTSVANQYATDPTISAKTDWVFSMPTRRYSVAANYAAVTDTVPATNAPTYRLFSQLVTPANVPAVQWFRPGNTSTDVLGNICVNANGQRFFDREESTPGATGTPPVFSPGNPSAPAVVRFCGETSVLAFKDPVLSVLGADVARTTITSGVYINGWGNIDTVNGGAGLPILGNSFIKLTNPNVGNNVSGTYGITWPHRFTRVQTVN